MPHSLVSHRHLISCLLPTKDQPVKPRRQPQSEIICWISNLEGKLLQGQIFQIGLVFWQMHQVEIPLVSVPLNLMTFKFHQKFSLQLKISIYRVFNKSFAKIEHLQILLVIGEKYFWFFVTNPVESVKSGAVGLIPVRIMLRNHLFLCDPVFSAPSRPIFPLYPVSAKLPIKELNLPIQSMIRLNLPRKL